MHRDWFSKLPKLACLVSSCQFTLSERFKIGRTMQLDTLFDYDGLSMAWGIHDTEELKSFFS